ncbi:MAG: hypothetical protein ACKERG_02505 [Candidatus Hodgkinia cicadicola]
MREKKDGRLRQRCKPDVSRLVFSPCYARTEFQAFTDKPLLSVTATPDSKPSFSV